MKLYRYHGIVVRVANDYPTPVRLGNGEFAPATGTLRGIAPLPKRLRAKARRSA